MPGMKPAIERILERSSKESNGCWIWQGAKTPRGYGQIGSGRQYVHRIVYHVLVGPVGKMFVLHKCDNPSCVNPAHLFLGTQADNVRDMWNKGRGKVCLDGGWSKRRACL